MSLQNENEFAVGSASGKLFIIDSEEIFDLKQTFNLTQGEILSAKFCPESEILFISGSDSNVFSIKKNSQNKKFEVLGKVRGQSHTVFALEILKSQDNQNKFNQNENLKDSKNWKLVCGGENSDLCVIDYNIDGFSQKLDNKGKRGYRHVLENTSSLLQSTLSPNFFIRRGHNFTELLEIDRSNPEIAIKNKFSLEHSNPIPYLDMCEKSQSLITYHPETQEIIQYNTLSGTKKTIIQNISISWLKYFTKYLAYFDNRENQFIFLNKHQKFEKSKTINAPWPQFVPDQVNCDIQERFLLAWDKIQEKVAVYNFQTEIWTDVSSIYSGKNIINCLLLHPFETKIFYLDSRNRLFTFCLKTKSTFKIDLSEREIPKNLQIYKILGSLHKNGVLLLISDYHVIHVDISKKISSIFKKNQKILSIVPVIDTKSKINKSIL